jgi:hypothetical protein
MKVIIDLIDDIREAINNESGFSLSAMGLEKNEQGEYVPLWQADINQYKLDDEAKKLYLFLGKENAVKVGAFLNELNTLSNKQMMYELCVSYTKENKRVDASLMGFGESIPEEKYLLFISEII